MGTKCVIYYHSPFFKRYMTELTISLSDSLHEFLWFGAITPLDSHRGNPLNQVSLLCLLDLHALGCQSD